MRALASHNRLSGTLMPLIILVVLILNGVIMFQRGAGNTAFVFLLVAIVVNVLVIYGNHKDQKDIFFDDNTLYLKGLDNREEIPFTNLISLKLTADSYKIMGFTNHKYSIQYYRNNNEVRDVNFWTTFSNPDIDDFTERVLKINPRFIGRHSSF